jgi:hypothetical protein
MWWPNDNLLGSDRRVRGLALVLLFSVALGCSWTHHVRIENASAQHVEVTYKLSCPHRLCFFPDSALVKPTNERDAAWSVHRLNAQDSTIRFTLPPGHRADLASTWNTTYSYIHATTSAGATTDNLVWMEVDGAGHRKRYSAAEFLDAADTRRSGVTLLRISDRP